MTIKAIEFTHDIDKPRLVTPQKSKNSLKKSKTLDNYNNQNDVEEPDLIRRKLSSDDEEYYIRSQNAAKELAEREKYIEDQRQIMEVSKKKKRDSDKIHHQQNDSEINNQGESQLPQNNSPPNNPISPGKKTLVGLKRRPIPVRSPISSPNTNDNSKKLPNSFRSRPLPISLSNTQNNSHVNNTENDDDYSYSYSYSENASNLPIQFPTNSKTDHVINPNMISYQPSQINPNDIQNTDVNPNIAPEADSNINNNQNNILNPNITQMANSEINSEVVQNNSNQPTNSDIISDPNLNANSDQITNPNQDSALKVKYLYRMEKNVVSRIPKKKKKYSLSLGNNALIEAEYVKNKKRIQFYSRDVETKKDNLYTMLLGNGNSSFCLRNGLIYDPEIFSMRLVEVEKPIHYYSVFLHSFISLQNFPKDLVNQPPNCNLDSSESTKSIFGKKNNDIISDKLNWIFCSEDNEELIVVTKESKTSVIIETVPGPTYPMLFTIALAAFIGKVDK